jgi:DNA processing protein
MGWNEVSIQPKKQKELLLDLNPKEKKIIDLLREIDNVEIDVMLKKLQSSTGDLATSLLELELRGLILSLPGKRYKLA